jgi:3-hydroxyacyl-CoA dehydrogenase/enoyl-CoA hydratase/carnithine racemase
MSSTGTTTPTAPEEVVTEAKLRLVEIPSGTFALITIDNGRDHTRPSTFGLQGLTSLQAAIDEALATPGVVGIGVTGKPFIFAVGADLSAIGMVTDASVIEAFGRLGHDVFRKLGETSLPTFAFVNGAAMGGGMELALHCDYRTLDSSAAGLSLPEVFLGLIPGWGGAWILPNLIGPQRALDVIINNSMNQNKQLRPAQALDLGIVDAVFESADFLERSLMWADDVIAGRIQAPRAHIDRASWDQVVDGYRAGVDARIHGATPAPYRALDLVQAAKTASRDEGFAAEDSALAELVMGDDLRASLYSFDLVQKRAKRPVGVPDKELARPVTKVGIVGAGLMASQLAMLFARRLQVPVVMSDLDQERVDAGVTRVHADIDGLAAKGRLSADKASRLKALVTGTVDTASFADANFVLEAVFEDLDVKKKVFAGLESVVSTECILATNTSSLSVTAMAADLQHPERVVGFHFFNPVAVMPLLEIARAERTDDATVATAFAVGKELKKSCVLVADAPAFVVNRLLIRYLGEITKAVDEGASFEVADRAMDPLGLPMSPFSLLQLVGMGVAAHVSESMHRVFPDRYYLSPNLQRLLDADIQGVWQWNADGTRNLDPKVSEVYQQGSTVLTEDQIRQRALDALADEARRMLDEGVVAEAQDIDLCMILGAGWPFWLGGLTPYLDRTGTAEAVTGQRFLAPGIASVPA